MNELIIQLNYTDLAISLIPVAVVIIIMIYWSLNTNRIVYALARMLIQLFIIGYLLNYIFAANQAWLIVLILLVMMLSSSWIALGSIKTKHPSWYWKAFAATLIGGGLPLIVITQLVLDLDPWYTPQYMIPIAGMIFASAMNSISLAAERFTAELAHGIAYQQARNIAFKAALIPIVNSLLAVGLVSLPGMMTGQILSGISPLIATRYQIMVMCMLFSSTGLASACFLMMIKGDLLKNA